MILSHEAPSQIISDSIQRQTFYLGFPGWRLADDRRQRCSRLYRALAFRQANCWCPRPLRKPSGCIEVGVRELGRARFPRRGQTTSTIPSLLLRFRPSTRSS